MRRFFIVGIPRSGTTLLQSILAAHPRIQSFPESHFFVDLRPHGILRQTGLSSRASVSRLRDFLRDAGRQDLADGLPRTLPLARSRARLFVALLDRMAAEAGAAAWVEKTPRHLHFIPTIERFVPDARFIHLLRRGEDVVASLYDVTRRYPDQWGGPRPVDACVQRWLEGVRISFRRRTDPRHLLLSYEVLATDPDTALREMSQFMGIELAADLVHRRADSTAGLGLAREPWKSGVSGHLRNADGSRFSTLFEAAERARIRDALRASEERLRTHFEVGR